MNTDGLWEIRDELDVASQEVATMSSRRESVSARDVRAVIEVTLDADLSLASIEVAHSWMRYYQGHQLGAAILATSALATQTSLRTWYDSIDAISKAKHNPRPVPTTMDFEAQGLPRPGTPLPEEALTEMGKLLDQLVDSVDRAVDELVRAKSANYTGSSRAGHVQITLAAGRQLKAVALSPGWPERNPASVINKELAEAVASARLSIAGDRSTVTQIQDIGQQLQGLARLSGLTA